MVNLNLKSFVGSCINRLQMNNFLIFKSLILKFADVIGLLTKIKPIESRITKKKTPTDVRQIEILMPE